jgi:hypothetical protein
MMDTYRQTRDRTKPRAALLAEQLIEIYSTPTPKGWHKPKSKGTSFYWSLEVSIVMVGVQYLYSRLDYESWSNKTEQNLENKVKIS